MAKYVIEFSKTGTICYISHLDLMRLFKRIFKRTGIDLVYSQGFNPHPKMGFAQPLSLGYWGMKELIEFETVKNHEPAFIEKKLKAMFPIGLELISCKRLDGIKKTLAAETVAAEYMIAIPLYKSINLTSMEVKNKYLDREKIIAMKKKKHSKEPVETDIKPMIREIEFVVEPQKLFVNGVFDSGSTSNLSPELVIDTLKKTLDIETGREEIEVMRKEIMFNKGVIIK